MKIYRLQAAAFRLFFSLLILIVLSGQATAAPNTNGITNTRHNLLVPYSAQMSALLGVFYNNYGEVCVYCHTPHGGESSNAPLWNRTVPATGSYTPYSSSTIDTNGGVIPQPDGISLACLSCHDGTIAVDSIVNAPGSGTAWSGSAATNHYTLSQYPDQSTNSCLLCHRTGVVTSGASFEAMALTQNLSGQHPISMNYPTAAQDPAFNQSYTNNGKIAWFEETGNSRADDNELKLYSDGAGGYKVQCATCHNPHGTLSSDGVNLYSTFLRKSNSSSAICTTCHIK